MELRPACISYADTGFFSKIILDYLKGNESLRSFYSYEPSFSGIASAIAARKNYNTNRKLLVERLRASYSGRAVSQLVQENINRLESSKTFTVTTAHQPNIFTGHLYFVYKILHAIKLAEELESKFEGHHFVPVYYMGSEDADLEELGEVNINGKKYSWETKQSGAVGRMKVDKPFIDLIAAIEGQLSVEPHGSEIIAHVKKYYTVDKTIEQATFEFVHALFGQYGLVILLPDDPALKKEFSPVIRKELDEQFSYTLVGETTRSFPDEYKVQAAGRELNLFYLKDDVRERIQSVNSSFLIANTELVLSKEETETELENYPERFSPNVILRPVFQEMILPNVAFIGGGGEIAYWLELKSVFDAVDVPYPVLVLRNSFLVVNKKAADLMATLQLSTYDLFIPETELIRKVIERESNHRLNLNEEKQAVSKIYEQIATVAGNIDTTLNRHVEASTLR